MSCRLRLHSSWPPALRAPGLTRRRRTSGRPAQDPVIGQRLCTASERWGAGCHPQGPAMVPLQPLAPRCFWPRSPRRSLVSVHGPAWTQRLAELRPPLTSLLLLLFSSGIYYVFEFMSVLGGGSCHFVEGLWGRVKGLGGP